MGACYRPWFIIFCLLGLVCGSCFREDCWHRLNYGRVKMRMFGDLANCYLCYCWFYHFSRQWRPIMVADPLYIISLVSNMQMRGQTWHLCRDDCISPDGRRLGSCSHDRTMQIWEAETGWWLRRLAPLFRQYQYHSVLMDITLSQNWATSF